MNTENLLKKNLTNIQNLLKNKEFTKAEKLLQDNLKIEKNNFKIYEPCRPGGRCRP